MRRNSEEILKDWYAGPRRKPLVLRGARQVGKSTLVRNFANAQGIRLAEVNLERHLELTPAFAGLDVDVILLELEALTSQVFSDSPTLLFLDEIQAIPSALQALRYLYEERPDLPVLAAGSLLEFTLADHAFSMPVGRIAYHHLGPMNFREFVDAVEPLLLPWLDAVGIEPIPDAAHRKLLARHRQFLFVGGMPEAILAFAESESMERVAAVHRSITDTYEDDFAKYARRDDLVLLQRIFRQIPQQTGRKLKYVDYSREHRSREVKSALGLLEKARICLSVGASHCSGVPLLGVQDQQARKLLFLDVGLANHVCGLDWLALDRLDDLRLVNEGPVAEQVVGQQLAYRGGGVSEPALAYWLRQGRTGNAEVDYVISHGPDLFPVEVKAGKSGALRSLHRFALEKPMHTALRFDLNQPSRQIVTAVDHPYTLQSLPLYAACEIDRILLHLRKTTVPS